MSVAKGAVALAARLLPRGMRDRYREQWMADLRDADEAGVPQHQIASGALTFAATVAQPWPWAAEGPPTAETARRRLRFAAALALSAALLALSTLGSHWVSKGLTHIVGYDLALELVDTVLVSFAVAAPIAAIVISARTKQATQRARVAIVLLAAVVVAPIAHGVIDNYPVVDGEIYYGLGWLAYLAGAIVVAIAVRMLWSELAPAAGVRRRPLLWASTVLAVGAALVTHAVIAWAGRTPISWSWQPGRGGTMIEGELVFEEIPVTQADYELWLALKAQFETMVTVGFVVLGLLALVLALAVLSRRLPTIATALAAIATLLIANAALLGLMGWTVPVSEVLPVPMLAVGRLLLVGVILVAVGDLRPLARVRHRRDVERGVQLL
jgi:phage gp36-like protein